MKDGYKQLFDGISITVARLSLIASVWIFIFNLKLWYAIPLFFILSIIINILGDSGLSKNR